LIAATNRDLEAMVSEQKFRSDLFFRLNVFLLRVPFCAVHGCEAGRLAAGGTRAARKVQRQRNGNKKEEKRRGSSTQGKESGMTLKAKTNETAELQGRRIQPHVEDSSANHAPSQEEIRRRAYEIYLERGGLPGRELEDWLQAEREFESAALFMRATTGENHRP
jgi:hypothetical protein